MDYPLEWSHESNKLEIMKVGMKTPLEPPLDENMNPKDPMDDLENILSGDGREGRRVITINNQVSLPTQMLEQKSARFFNRFGLCNEFCKNSFHGME